MKLTRAGFRYYIRRPRERESRHYSGTTSFVLGFSYSYEGFAFYWDGAGPAFWRVANSSLQEPVGTSWAAATGVPWGSEIILGLNVEAQAAEAQENTVTVFFASNDLD
ncbi:hypothetical protein C8R44DRAFT_885494 [Mycena epipterygia]|nr:hypothetical protein C8R44DRAFT_885494 [Mycena epipterygia]